jgi:demethylmenaquinone methyltransferase/2-methoxy-6-polyprenyl-1,4-benzoquinol methylase
MPTEMDAQSGRDEESEYYSLTERVFKILAPFYDCLVLPAGAWRRKVVTLVRAPQGARVLDVATGTGRQAFAFAREGHDVVGLDISEAMISVARKKNRLSNLKFESGDATRLRFDNGSFDVTTISFALHDMLRTIQQRVLGEMVRVTKDQGSLILVDYGLPACRAGRWLAYHVVKAYEGKYYVSFIRSDFEGLVRSAGIQIVAHHNGLLGVARALVAVKR